VTRAALLFVLASSSALAGAPAPKRVVTLWPDLPAQPATTPDLLEVGERVYKGACLGCHGEKGDGLGREGKFLAIPPRDFTTGQFIIRTTPLGTLPWDTDLFGSIRRGFRPGVGMPAFTFLSDREVPPVPANLASLAGQGQGVFMSGGACFVCHGMQGKGDGPAAPGLVYVSGKHQGKKVSPANLHRSDWFKGGGRPEDMAMRIDCTGGHGEARFRGRPCPAADTAVGIHAHAKITPSINLRAVRSMAASSGSPS